jgi:CRISPR-associated protein Csm2
MIMAREFNRDYNGASRNVSALQVNFYNDSSKKTINPTLLDSDAEKQADMLHSKISSAQTRKFFGEVKNLYLRLKQGRSWSELEPVFRMLKSKAFYASKAGNAKIPDEFRAFITDNVDRVKDEEDFKAFVMYFEAVLGFAYGKGLVKK